MSKQGVVKLAVFLVAYGLLRVLTCFLGKRALWLLMLGVLFVVALRACLGCG